MRLTTPRRGSDGQRWRLYTYVQSGLYITTADRLADHTALQHNVIRVAVLRFVVALPDSLVVLWLGIRRGLRPLAHRAYVASLPVVPPDTLNQLLVRTRNALRREQRFTNYAAHELRTPLTAIKTHVQLAYEPIVQAEAGIARLQATLEQLLMLARLETDPNGINTVPVSSATIVTAALADLASGARTSVDDTGAPAMVEVPHELAVAALRICWKTRCSIRPTARPCGLRCTQVKRESCLLYATAATGRWDKVPSG